MRNLTAKQNFLIDIGIIIFLVLGLFLSTLELAYLGFFPSRSQRQGQIPLNLNDGEPIIQDSDLLLQAGMTVERDFFLENNSTNNVYYRLYFDDISGELSSLLIVTIKDGDTTLYDGAAAQLTKSNKKIANDILHANQRKDLTIRFYLPENGGNQEQSHALQFSIYAEAIHYGSNLSLLFN